MDNARLRKRNLNRGAARPYLRNRGNGAPPGAVPARLAAKRVANVTSRLRKPVTFGAVSQRLDAGSACELEYGRAELNGDDHGLDTPGRPIATESVAIPQDLRHWIASGHGLGSLLDLSHKERFLSVLHADENNVGEPMPTVIELEEVLELVTRQLVCGREPPPALVFDQPVGDGARKLSLVVVREPVAFRAFPPGQFKLALRNEVRGGIAPLPQAPVP